MPFPYTLPASLPGPPAIALLFDAFATKDTTKWGWAGTAGVVSGQLSLPYSTTFANQIASRAPYDATNGSVSAKFVGFGTGPPVDGNTALMVSDGIIGGALAGTYFVGLQLNVGNTISGWYSTDGASFPNLFTGVTYNPAQHVYFRIRFSGTTVYLEVTDATAQTWTILYSGASPMAQVNSIYVGFQTGCTTAPSGSPAAVWDYVNILPMSTLTDDFSTQDTVTWTYALGASVASGQLNLPIATGGYIEANRPYILTDSAIVGQMAQAAGVSAAGGDNAFYVYGDFAATSYLGIDVNNTVVGFNNQLTNLGSTTYDPVNHKWFRIRHSTAAGLVYLEAAPDGLTWTTLWSGTVAASGLADINTVFPGIQAYYTSGAATPTTALWDNVGLPPVAGTHQGDFFAMF